MFDITTRLSRDPYFMVDYSINSGLFLKGGINYTLSRVTCQFITGETCFTTRGREECPDAQLFRVLLR